MKLSSKFFLYSMLFSQIIFRTENLWGMIKGERYCSPPMATFCTLVAFSAYTIITRDRRDVQQFIWGHDKGLSSCPMDLKELNRMHEDSPFLLGLIMGIRECRSPKQLRKASRLDSVYPRPKCSAKLSKNLDRRFSCAKRKK